MFWLILVCNDSTNSVLKSSFIFSSSDNVFISLSNFSFCLINLLITACASARTLGSSVEKISKYLFALGYSSKLSAILWLYSAICSSVACFAVSLFFS